MNLLKVLKVHDYKHFHGYKKHNVRRAIKKIGHVVTDLKVPEHYTTF